jgi:hypothetical protein
MKEQLTIQTQSNQPEGTTGVERNVGFFIEEE